MACEEYSQEVFGFSDVIAIGNPNPNYDSIVSTSSPTLTPIGDSDFLLEEVDAFLALEDDPTSREVDHSYYDTEGDILLLEAFFNDDLSLPPPNQGIGLAPKKGQSKNLRGDQNGGAKNLAANHLSRLENPHQSVLDKKEINEKFPLETLNMVSFRGDSSTPWFADFANYHAGNFIVKGMSSQQKEQILQRCVALLLGRPLLIQNMCGSSHPATAGDHPKFQLNELNELRNQAYENSLIYKEKTKRIHDSKIKDRVFNVGNRVLRFNSRLKIFSGKIKTGWSGPFTITNVLPYGTIELSQTDGPNFKKFLDFEDSCSGFCPSITGSSLHQLH
uniref:Reverse transcriptase domain-containing protein n=1 Tax=Tanacetum cinerariifolium TaxID=118510 RepID=A0A6L2K5J7_TANCI|nr:reverse transcriptase domain-containing protein [Tanacetum cinerariifolium]